MMEDDLISCLTRQVKEDVIEHYLSERRLLELQVEEIDSLAQQAWALADETGRRFTRLGFLMVEPAALEQLLQLLRIRPRTFWDECLHKPFAGGVRFIQVIALTSRAKFRKLVLEAYRRLIQWTDQYRQAFENLEVECKAINKNIKEFQNRFDLLAILNFLKSLDVCALEQKHFLGENFTAEEMASVERKLYIHAVSLDRFDLPPPPNLIAGPGIEEAIGNLSATIYKRHAKDVKRFLR